jgi:glycogen operon protein
MLRFTAGMIALRKRHASLRRRHFVAPPDAHGNGALLWYDIDGEVPDWHAGDARVLCFDLKPEADGEAELFAILNMTGDAVDAVLPVRGSGRWHRVVDTSLPPPDDIVVPEHGVAAERVYRAGPESVVVLERR